MPINMPDNAQTIKGQDVSKEDKMKDEILNKVVICETSGKPFRIIRQELEFYRKHNLPLPSKHPDIRHAERMKART